MKRYLCILFALLVLLCTVGCHNSDENMADHAKFYYCVNSTEFHPETPVIDCEARSVLNLNSLDSQLKLYLSGPLSETLYSPFPQNIILESLDISNDQVTVYLSNSFATVTGYKRTIACVCLVKTVMELTNCNSVTIDAGAKENPARVHVILTEADTLLLDEAK